MAHRTAVILCVGLTGDLITDATPNLRAFLEDGESRALRPVAPAVTCPVQSSMLTGHLPREHGIVGNGWYDRALAEVHFWKQSNALVSGEKVWESARRRDPSVTTANLFWWFNMHSSADVSVTPRPIYKADGRKIPDCYSRPGDLRGRLQAELGRFPLFHFWGPASSIRSTEWIAEAAKRVQGWHDPTLTLVYLPHLDYALQQAGPDSARAREAACELDGVAGGLIEHFRSRGVRVMLASEYGIERASGAVHVNRVLREAGLLEVREELGHEMLDTGASRAFAVADHQVAHVYVKDAGEVPAIARLLAAQDGVAIVADRSGQAELGLDHARSGDLVLIAEAGRWFTYYYWLDDARAPDFARTVDIHRKPGYDPAELFIDPMIRMPWLRIARKLLAKSLGFRTLMDFIPLDASLVQGTHGRPDGPSPVLITERGAPGCERLGAVASCTEVRDVILAHLLE
jgi:predicted AlkP superfamily pyrophosphatase or phosphodiesterase